MPQPVARCFAVVPCAGVGARAGTGGPKQYTLLAGRSVVAHTLDVLGGVTRLAATLVVLAPDDRQFEQHAPAFTGPRAWTARCGGATRAATVAAGLQQLRERGAVDHDWVLVHDAARCLVTPELIDRLIDACSDDPVGGLLAHPVPDTLKRAAGGRVAATTDRSHHWLAQTPQMFRIGALHAALQAAGTQVTDESSALEAIGLAPKLVPGSASNFKVTYADDFALARAVLLGRGHKPGKELDYDYP